MKIALFALGFLAFAQGIQLEEGSSMYLFLDSRRNLCEGFVVIKTEFNGIETIHGKLIKEEREDFPNKAYRLKYNRPPIRRSARKLIEVQGNCCWRFYQRYGIFSHIITFVLKKYLF